MMSSQQDMLIVKLVARLADRDPVIRRNAVGSLRLWGHRAAAAAAALDALLEDEDAYVRREAQRALERVRSSTEERIAARTDRGALM